MGNPFTKGVGNLLTEVVGKVLDIYKKKKWRITFRQNPIRALKKGVVIATGTNQGS